MEKTIGHYAQYPELLVRSLFFEEFKQLLPEAIEDLKNKSFYHRKRMCHLLIWRGMKLDEWLEAEAPEDKNSVRNHIIGAGDLIDDHYIELSDKYYESLEGWAQKWNLGKDVWESEPEWIVYQAGREIDSLLDPTIKSAFSYYYNPSHYKGTQVSKEQIKRMYSPEEMERIYGPEWRKTVERGGIPWEEKLELMCMPPKEDDPVLFTRLFNKLINMLPDHHVLLVPKEDDYFHSSNGWNPLTETRSEAAERLKADFENHLETHLNLKEELAKKAGLKPIPSTLRRKRLVERLRFEWLILFQTQGWSKNQIANHYDVDRKAVRDSIKTEAKFIGLKLSNDY